MLNYYRARIFNLLAFLFCHMHYFLKGLAIRAEYRQKLYYATAEAYIVAMQKEHHK